jgi:GR25 family glycosyltransferase involved in LPS biosynthesis
MIYDICIVISLERRKDRSERVFKHLEERGIKNIYALPAYDGIQIMSGIVKIIPPHRSYFSFRDELTNQPVNYLNRFQIGCTLSHVSALKFAKMLKANRALIVEDDVEFAENIQDVLKNIEVETQELDWEHIYLGGAIRNNLGKKNIQKVTEHLYTTSFTDGLHAYLVKETGFDKIADAMLSFKTTNDDAVNDIICREENPLKAFMYLPKSAFQIMDFSELDRKIVNRQDLK